MPLMRTEIEEVEMHDIINLIRVGEIEEIEGFPYEGPVNPVKHFF